MPIPNIHDPSGHGFCNPLDDGPDEVENTIEMVDGQEFTKAQVIDIISDLFKRVDAREYEHEDGLLVIEIPFENSES